MELLSLSYPPLWDSLHGANILFTYHLSHEQHTSLKYTEKLKLYRRLQGMVCITNCTIYLVVFSCRPTDTIHYTLRPPFCGMQCFGGRRGR